MNYYKYIKMAYFKNPYNLDITKFSYTRVAQFSRDCIELSDRRTYNGKSIYVVTKYLDK